MKRLLLTVASVAIGMLAPAAAVHAQGDAVAGGATGETAVCIQVGDLSTGNFVGLYSMVDRGRWEEKSFTKPGAFPFEEGRRTEELLDIIDTSRQLSVQFDFTQKKVRLAQGSRSSQFSDLYHILNATDRDGATDCLSLASRLGKPSPAGPDFGMSTGTGTGGGGTGGGGPGGGASRPGGGTTVSGGPAGPVTFVQNITIRPGTTIVIQPGSRFSATSGPPCPGQPGFFLCPNRFSCAPVGGVCCPGVGACAPGTFCDRFVPNACIGAGNPRFCAGSGNPATGVSLHCPVGSNCIAGPFCNP